MTIRQRATPLHDTATSDNIAENNTKIIQFMNVIDIINLFYLINVPSTQINSSKVTDYLHKIIYALKTDMRHTCS